MSKVAVVTGGTRGIGHAISIELKNRGYSVAAIYGGNDEAAHKFQAETGIPIFKWDVGDYDACAAGLKQVETQLGPISIIVNNAGITRDAMLHRMTPQQWKDVIRVDLDSVFNMVQPVINGMRDRGFGRIINISSMNGQKGQIGQSNYSAAKAGIIGFTKAIAQENARKGHNRQLRRSRLHRHGNGVGCPGEGPRKYHCADSGRPPRQGGRDCQMRRLPGE